MQPYGITLCTHLHMMPMFLNGMYTPKFDAKEHVQCTPAYGFPNVLNIEIRHATAVHERRTGQPRDVRGMSGRLRYMMHSYMRVEETPDI